MGATCIVGLTTVLKFSTTALEKRDKIWKDATGLRCGKLPHADRATPSLSLITVVLQVHGPSFAQILLRVLDPTFAHVAPNGTSSYAGTLIDDPDLITPAQAPGSSTKGLSGKFWDFSLKNPTSRASETQSRTRDKVGEFGPQKPKFSDNPLVELPGACPLSASSISASRLLTPTIVVGGGLGGLSAVHTILDFNVDLSVISRLGGDTIPRPPRQVWAIASKLMKRLPLTARTDEPDAWMEIVKNMRVVPAGERHRRIRGLQGSWWGGSRVKSSSLPQATRTTPPRWPPRAPPPRSPRARHDKRRRRTLDPAFALSALAAAAVGDLAQVITAHSGANTKSFLACGAGGIFLDAIPRCGPGKAYSGEGAVEELEYEDEIIETGFAGCRRTHEGVPRCAAFAEDIGIPVFRRLRVMGRTGMRLGRARGRSSSARTGTGGITSWGHRCSKQWRLGGLRERGRQGPAAWRREGRDEKLQMCTSMRNVSSLAQQY
ncbi:hypothetical protein C8R45DRAFT_941100 [Mycena sanguinolenta]|nr:hypothetical protein C8R45DRAFT_941100 [Mycena sanguinolenta]